MIFTERISQTEKSIRLESTGMVIGHLELLADKVWLVEVMNQPFHLHVEKSRMLKGLIIKVYKNYLIREYKARKQLRSYQDFKTIG